MENVCFYFNSDITQHQFPSTPIASKLAQGVCEIQNSYLYPVKGWSYYMYSGGSAERLQLNTFGNTQRVITLTKLPIYLIPSNGTACNKAYIYEAYEDDKVKMI